MTDEMSEMVKIRTMVDGTVWLPIQEAIGSLGLTLNDILEDKRISRAFFELVFAIAVHKVKRGDSI